jgi:hypothetical protein
VRHPCRRHALSLLPPGSFLFRHTTWCSYKDCEDRCSQAANLTDDTRVRLSGLVDAYAESVVMGQVKRLPSCPSVLL